MAKKGKLSRRSFLTRVAGTTLAAGAAASITGVALAQNRTGQTDSDSGSNADRAGYGRTGATDSDTGGNSDRVGYGRGSRSSGVTDSDTGGNSDPVGNGRGSSSDRGGSGRNCSDTDSGTYADRGGNGRSCSDSDR